jgi:hypothetical protein
MGTQRYFSADYAEARDKFRAACTLAGVATKAYENPTPGPGGTTLTIDLALFGPADASNLLILTSGVHGIEGLAGCGCQTAWIAEGHYRDIPQDVAVLIVHAVNCYGVAHVQYTTEGNVDLNQNFLDFDQPLPENPAYEDIHEAMCCPELDGPLRDEATAFLAEYTAQNGEETFLEALWQGQHSHADGLSFSGTEPTWSHLTTLEFLAEFAGAAKQICLLDTHTGVGAYGYGSIFTLAETGDPALKKARAWIGPALNTPLAQVEGSSDSIPFFPLSHGYMQTGYIRALPHAEVTPIGLEFGSLNEERLMALWLANHWLTFHGDVESELGQKIKREIQAGFSPGTEDWTQMISPRWTLVIGQVLRGLGGM